MMSELSGFTQNWCFCLSKLSGLSSHAGFVSVDCHIFHESFGFILGELSDFPQKSQN